MTQCQHCTRKTALPLCTPCTKNLANLLAELPWLIHQLDITLTRQDKLHTGTGHTSLNSNPINVGAMELMRQTADALHRIALDVAQIYGAEQIPALVNAAPTQVARWLTHNVGTIQRHPKAGEHYTTISELVGDTKPGPIHAVINRPDLRFAGPCPSIRAHTNNGDIRCNHMVYAHDGETYVDCPRCGTTIDIEQNRRRAATQADLLPYQTILEVLESLGEPVRPATLAGWISSGRLKPQGFLTRKGWNKRRIRPSDPRVYSIARARALRQTQPHAIAQ